MAVKDRKTRKLRGSNHHGWGIQKHRGKGSQGGAGNSGWYKQKWCKYSKYFKDMHGSHGFTRHSSDKEINAINIRDIERNIEKFVNEGKMTIKEGTYYLNLASIGYDKLLGDGKISHKFIIQADSFSEGAKKKIESIGGMIESETKDDGGIIANDTTESSEKTNKTNTTEKDIAEK
ncbi:MAG: 50S ribosomal protein L15 [Candidatus Altiarchaeales archaeon HGW-Altiarchaeales-1]|nr:ribosomal protein L15 [uncultured archaeon]PKP59765.1 MAG: 50S ribosomal protein L15 [Candidatus Altiarchaeales archaeon HGW-Altiarchaeales-1]